MSACRNGKCYRSSVWKLVRSRAVYKHFYIRIDDIKLVISIYCKHKHTVLLRLLHWLTVRRCLWLWWVRVKSRIFSSALIAEMSACKNIIAAF